MQKQTKWDKRQSSNKTSKQSSKIKQFNKVQKKKAKFKSNMEILKPKHTKQGQEHIENNDWTWREGNTDTNDITRNR